MRILLVYPGPTHSTYDVARGYDVALRALGHTVEAFNYHRYITFYNEALKLQEGRNPLYKREQEDPFLLASERVVIQAIDFVPDVALIIAGGALHKRAHDMLNKMGIPIALLLTESPYLDEMQSKIVARGHVAVTFTNDKNSVATLQKVTDKPVLYLPHSYDPSVHHPGADKKELHTDVFFHGTLWPERVELFSQLRDLPRAHIGGYTLDTADHEKEIIDNAQMADHYRSAKIAINHHRTYTDSDGKTLENGVAYSIGPRAYEIAACGAFQLCDDTRPELREVFGDSVATYSDAADLRSKIDYYLQRDCERVNHALQSWYAVRDCTFEDRATNIVIPALEEVLNG